MVLVNPSKPDTTDVEESWTTRGSKKEMLEFCTSWNTLIRDLLSYPPEGEVMKWTLNMHRLVPY
jgi:salicylate hydroxylase